MKLRSLLVAAALALPGLPLRAGVGTAAPRRPPQIRAADPVAPPSAASKPQLNPLERRSEIAAASSYSPRLRPACLPVASAKDLGAQARSFQPDPAFCPYPSGRPLQWPVRPPPAPAA